jgi:hypothetical protein
MFECMNDKKKAIIWKTKADLIKKNTNKFLWNNKNGFYKIHQHINSLKHDFKETEMFAMGGNTQAILAGIANENKKLKIIHEAMERQKLFKMSTISGTLLPPYPEDTFKHPLMDDPFEYQNGAQWDWFGGRLILSMFKNGFSYMAKEKLMEIIRKNLANGTFYEWDNKDGIGCGSDYFTGSAGIIGRAVFEGYFGIEPSHDSLTLSPKIGTDYAKVHFYEPSNDFFVAYEYSFNSEENTLFMKYNSNFHEKGKIKLLNPWFDSIRTKKDLFESLLVQLNGRKIDFNVIKINRDLIIELETDFNNNILNIQYRE